MEKRIFLAVLISIAFLWLWAAIAPKLFPELAKPRPSTASRSTAPATATAAQPASSSTATSTDTTATSTAADAPPADMAPSASEPAQAPVISGEAPVETVVDREEFIARFTNRGAQLISFRLKKHKTKGGELVELVKARDPRRVDYPFAIEARDPRLTQIANHSLYAVSERREGPVTVLEYRYGNGVVAITKTFRLTADYEFQFASSVTPPAPYRVIVGPGIRTLAPDERDSQFVTTGNGVVQANQELEVIPREDADPLTTYPAVDFIGIEDNYFLAVLKPGRAGEAILRRVETQQPGAQPAKRRDLYAGVNAAADGTLTAAAFLGPKQTQTLERHGLESTLQFGWFGFIARMLLDALLWINKATKNYGFAIIVLTIIIKIILYPLQHKSIVSMKKMQKAQPKMEAIKQKYKKARTDPEQRQKMNVEMMKLYQQEGINPMGGCLPILLQLPILWGFYGMLSRAIELRGAPFMLWVRDLSDKDPYYITPILMTATMFIQQAITPTTADPMQKRIFMIMPLVFGWIFKEFPSGLVLYWLVQNILTIIQQMIMNKWWKDHPDELKETT
ncbi:MAG TPA: membrane protein insertase YidC [Thermoanaerobaculia bacterium]|nr:membrane protein insertase YidC [Thermoanaerobaculia bacterium]